jgi:hypothetical protein
MLKRICLIAVVIVLAFSALPAFTYGGGDTGTYRISQYIVALTPMQDGTTKIEYYQKWVVTGGHIPWITVGVPNDDYDIMGSGLAVSKASPHNSGQESLVRLDLDQDYNEGESFEIQFTINQRQLFRKADSSYIISFTPGWYDRAVVDSLEIRLNSLCNASETSTQPAPSYQNGNAMVWSGIRLNESGRYIVTFTFPKTYASKAAISRGSGDSKTSPVVFPIIIITVLIISYFVKRSLGMDDYSGGGIFHGGRHSGSCYVSSCACACAGCACACACAGGGGAGCSRKNQHICPACTERDKADNVTTVICEHELHKHAESIK